MRADGSVNAAGLAQLGGAHDLVVQGFAHAVQALEFIVGDAVALGPGIDDGQGLRVVGGELRIDGSARGQQLLRAHEVRHVGVDFARVDRISVHAVDLGALDFSVPIRALDQAHHELAAAAARQVDQVIDHEGAAFLIRLHHETDAVEAGQVGIEGHRLHQVERQFQAVGFFGVDVQADVVFFCQHDEGLQARQQLRHHAGALGAAVARVQGRQLDGDAGAVLDAAPVRGAADGVDRAFIRGVVTGRVGFRERRLAQHVVGIAVAAGFVVAAVFQRFLYRLAGNELVAEHAHGHVDALAYQRFAALGDEL